MKRIAIFTFAISSLQISAQPVIDSVNYTPVLWEMFERSTANMSAVDYRTSGANHTWNFISIPVTSVDTIMYDSVDTDNCHYTYPSFTTRKLDFALINLSYPAGNQVYDSEFKEYTSAGAFESGTGYCSGYISDYYYKHFPFPLSISTTYSVSHSVTGYNINPPVTTYSGWYRTLIADGYGTLNLPGISYPNCLRLQERLIDTVEWSGQIVMIRITSGWLRASTILYWKFRGQLIRIL